MGTGTDPARLGGGGKGGARRGHREPTDNGIPGTKNNNQVFAFISRVPAAASGSRAEGGARHGARPGLRTAQVGPRAGSAYLSRLLPVPRRVPSGSARRSSKSRVRWEGWGRRRAREMTATSSHPGGPRGSEPSCLSPGALPCLWGARLSRGAERALGTLAPHQDRRCAFRSYALFHALRQHPAPASPLVHGPLEGSPNPAPATITQFPLGRARGLHWRSRKCAVPGPFPCSETAPRRVFLVFPTQPPAPAGVPGWEC